MLWNRAQCLFIAVFEGNWHSARDFCLKKPPPFFAFAFGDVLESTTQVVCPAGVLSEPPPKTWIEKDMLAGPKVETMESVKLYLSYKKKGSKWSQPTTAGCRESAGKSWTWAQNARVPACHCWWESIRLSLGPLRDALRCWQPVWWEEQSGYLLVSTHITYNANIVIIHRATRL